MFEAVKEKLKEIRSELVALDRPRNASERAKMELVTRGISSEDPREMLRVERDGYNHENRFSTAAKSILERIESDV